MKKDRQAAVWATVVAGGVAAFVAASVVASRGKKQAPVLEVGKDTIRTTLTVVQTRSGNESQFQNDKAR